MTKDGLITAFEQFGEIINGDVIKCPFNNKCKVYFIEINRVMDGYILKVKQLHVM